jgi:uncharacterized membrane protein (Fun14 family)
MLDVIIAVICPLPPAACDIGALKWMLIIVSFLAGMFLIGVQLLHKYGYVSTVNWDKLGCDLS